MANRSYDLLLGGVDPHIGSEFYPIDFLESNMTPLNFANYVVAHREEVFELFAFSLIVAEKLPSTCLYFILVNVATNQYPREYLLSFNSQCSFFNYLYFKIYELTLKTLN
ncbi:hypothetical protein AtEden1_Chr1g0022541 [Arabidopsis thaliana]